jgi:hypothetical protein
MGLYVCRKNYNPPTWELVGDVPPPVAPEVSCTWSGEGQETFLALPRELPDGSRAGILRWFWSAPRFGEYPAPVPVEVQSVPEEFHDERVGGCVVTLQIGDQAWKTVFEARWCRERLQRYCLTWAESIIAEVFGVQT